MGGILLKTFIASSFVSVIMGYYYLGFGHTENFNGYLSYALLLAISYGVYKWYHLYQNEGKVQFGIFSLFLFFLLQLFLFCITYFSITDSSIGLSFLVFLKILYFLFIPILFSFIFYGLGTKILSFIPSFKGEEKIFQTLVSFGIGFFAFITAITIVGFLGLYTFYSTLFILVLAISLSWKEIFSGYKELFAIEISFDNHMPHDKNWTKKLAPYLLSSEFLFIVASALISVNLISVLRPFPIGWDDLGVYMNMPHLLAGAGEIFPIGGMVTWQIFTGLGFVLGSTTQAFFLNSFAGIITFVCIYLILHFFFEKNTEKKFFFNIPLLISTFYLALPMVIFHLAKDMKLDQGVFFVSILSLFILYYVFYHKESLTKQGLIYLGLAGILTGLAFSIKITTLLLILSSLALIVFSFLGGIGFLGFLGLFFSVFTYFGLWKMMNVVYPFQDVQFVQNFSIISFLLGAMLLAFSAYKKLNIVPLCKVIGVYIIGIILALLPWFAFNISTIPSGGALNISTLLGGVSSGVYTPDYLKIHSQEFLNNLTQVSSMTNSGTATNEDMGRYFGYENGISNYVKLPWNLTMQVNQGGEFTDISYIFLAFLPVLLLFLPYRRKEYILGPSLLLLGFLYFFVVDKASLTNIASHFALPYGYAYILGGFLGVFFYLYFTLDLKSHKHMKLFIYNLVFSTLYVFLWTISAFGIVWYGILMYFNFFLILAFGFYYVFGYSKDDTKHILIVKFFSSFTLFFLFSCYFFFSAVPHMFSNLKATGNTNYKISRETEDESIFVAHPEYFEFLYALNIIDTKKEELLTLYKSRLLEAVSGSVYENGISSFLQNVTTMSLAHRFMNDLISSGDISDTNIKAHIRKVRASLYHDVLSPDRELQSDAIIYRMGTFMKYFIIKNNQRMYEDSLITEFGKYFYDKDNKDIAFERIKKLGMTYLLLDLNAATIDKSPDGDLTKRYEKLLFSFLSEKVDLVVTDSLCLQFALDKYKASSKKEADVLDFIDVAGVNYTGMTADGKIRTKTDKMIRCYSDMDALIKSGNVTNDTYTYLLPLANYINNPENGIKSDQELINFYATYVGVGFKALFKIP